MTLIPVMGIFAALHTGAHAALTFSYFYGENVQSGLNGAAVPGGSYTDLGALPAGFNGGQIRDYDNVFYPDGETTGSLVAQSPNGLNPANNPSYSGFSQVWSLGSGWGQNHTALGTEVIDSVIFYFHISIVSPNNSNNTFTLFSGLAGTEGTPVGSFVISAANDQNAFYGVEIPVSVAMSGFSIGKSSNHFPVHGFAVADEASGAASRRPGFAVFTHIEDIPEPSAALLGALGSLLLFHRRPNPPENIANHLQ